MEDHLYHRRTLGIILGVIFLLIFGTIATLVGLGGNYVAMSVLILYAVSAIPFFICLLIRNNFISNIIIDDIFNYLLTDLPFGMIKWIYNYSFGALLIPLILILWILIWTLAIMLLILTFAIFPILSIIICPIYAKR
jgi:hypothetical protein